MKSRCYNNNNTEYQNYGGRGIDICEEWLYNYDNFEQWALNNGYKENLTIDRIDVNKGYSPSNCRWAGRKLQGNNTTRNHYITYKGVTKTMQEWADELEDISYTTLRRRLNTLNWSIEKAFETPTIRK